MTAAVTPAATPSSTPLPSGPEPVRRRPRLRRPAYEPPPVAVVPRRIRPLFDDGSWVARIDVRRAEPALLPEDTVLRPPAPEPAHREADDSRPVGAVEPTVVSADLQRLATDLVRRMVEILAGRRAPEHLAGVAQPQVLRYLTASRDSGRDARQAAPPRRVHVAQPTPDAAELTAVCRFGPRFRALTVRLDRDRSGRRPAWHATAVRLL